MGYIDYIKNLFLSTVLAKVPWKLLIVAIDKEAHSALTNMHIPNVFLDLKCPTSFTTFNDRKDFNTLCFIKMDVVRTVMNVLKESTDYIVYLDGDIWVFRDFQQDLLQFQNQKYDIVFQCDEKQTGKCNCPCNNICMGFFMINTQRPDLMEYSNMDTYINVDHDQFLMNQRLKTGNIKFTTFDRLSFPNGVFAKNILSSNVAILHYNWLVGNEKKTLMQKNGHWKVDKNIWYNEKPRQVLL
jgi:hypothetical protein